MIAIGNGADQEGAVGTISLDLATLIDTRLLIQASSGGGKSWALRRLLEQSHGKVQQIVLDLEGEFKTLREAGFEYIIAGKDCDVEVPPKYAKKLARQLLEFKASTICDLYELRAHERIQFVRFFLEALVSAPRRLWNPVIVVVDEGHQFCPQAGNAESAGAVIDLATRGRKRGQCIWIATQRLSKLHKDVCAELGNKLVGRTGLDIDQKRAADELGINTKEERLSLRKLKPGEFYAYGPALCMIRKGHTVEAESGVVRCTVGPVKSPHPKVGARQIEAPPPPSESIRKIVASLTDLPAEAEREDRDLESARQEIARLTREVNRLQKDGTVNPDAEAQLRDARSEQIQLQREIESLSGIIGTHRLRFLDCGGQLADIAEKITGIRLTLESYASDLEAQSLAVVMSRTRPDVRTHQQQSVTARRTSMPANTALNGPQNRILTALAKCEAVGITHVNKITLAALAGYSARGGAFGNPLGSLRTQGLIDYPSSGVVCFTDAGRSAIGAVDSPASLEELHTQVLDLLNGPQRKLMEAILEAHPTVLSKDELAEATGYSSNGGAFNNPLGRLRSMGFVTKSGPIAATDILFPEGLA